MAVKVLQKVASMNAGGIEKLLITIHENLDTDRVQMDYYLNLDEEQFYGEEIESLGGRYFTPRQADASWIRYLRRIVDFYRFLKKNDYRIVHINEDLLASVIYVLTCKAARIPVVVVHSHNDHAPEKHSLLVRAGYGVGRWVIGHFADHFFACSVQAGKWLFPKKAWAGKNFRVVNNGIGSEEYIFDPEVRAEERQKLGVANRFVVGHIGRFAPQKNHEFLLDVFAEIFQRNPESTLLLVGDGDLKEKIEQKARDIGVEEQVIFLGLSRQVPRLLQAMDVFLFPSIFEGLGIVAVEAQAAGLKTICSKEVPPEAMITDYGVQLSLEAGAEKWAERILSFADGYERRNTSQEIIKAGFDIGAVTKWIEDFYVEQFSKR